jgi:peptidoglycan/LPS O-acetylase OafA/YrhL
MSESTLQRSVGYVSGLDLLRVLGMILVTAQHALSLAGYEDRTKIVAELSLGQLGVAIFLAISGLLAGDSPRSPLAWLFQRLRRLFPAFWIAMIVSFALTGAAGNKQFDLFQIISQLAGTGLFTHLSNLVNSPTWFVSLLLVCYVGTAAARLSAVPPVVIGCIVVAVCTVVVAREPHPWLSAHLLTYALANTIAFAPKEIRRLATWTAIAAAASAAVLHRPEFAYAALALGAIEGARAVGTVPASVRAAGDYAYEYYLVHGVALFAAMRFLPSQPVWATLVGVASACLAAVVLRRVVTFLDHAVTARLRTA